MASDHRRALGRRRRAPEPVREESVVSPEASPDDECARTQAARALRGFLSSLPDEQREVFVLAEFEQMTAPEIVDATGATLNTVYSRLRSARCAFERVVKQVRARERGEGS